MTSRHGFNLALLLALSAISSARAEYVLSNATATVTFAAPGGGLACCGVGAPDAPAFVSNGNPAAPGLWRVNFARRGATGQVERVVLDNRAPAAAVQFLRLPESNGMQAARLVWQGLSLPGETGVVDVAADVELLPDGESRWLIAVTNRSRSHGIWSVAYPCFNTVAPPGTADVLLPGGLLGGTLSVSNRAERFLTYPAAGMPVQFTAFIKEGHGLYIGAHDSKGRVKNLRLSAAQDLSFEHYPDAMMTPGASYQAPYPVSVRPFRGDWWTAAKLYRAWAITHLAGPETLLRNRPIPTAFKETGVLLLMWQDPMGVAQLVAQAQERFGVPLLIFWCEWNVWPFDHHLPEMFPARTNLARGVAAMRASGATAMPYMNARIWSGDHPAYRAPATERGKARGESGRIYPEFGGAVMCPSMPQGRDLWLETCNRLIAEGGVEAIYMDQIAAANPTFCFASGHEHAPGGAATWTPAYQALVARVRESARQQNRPLALLSETFTDAYLHEFDGGLPCWWEGGLFQDAIPLNQAIYSDRVIFAPNCDNVAIQSFAAYAMMQGRYFLWGLPFSVRHAEFENRPAACTELPRAHAFLRDASQVRLAAKEFMIYGELLREIEPTQPLPVVTVPWIYLREKAESELPMSFAAVRASLWRAANGDLGLALINFSDAPQTFATRLAPTAFGAPAGSWQVTRLTPGGETDLGAQSAPLALAETLPPYGVAFLVLRHAR